MNYHKEYLKLLPYIFENFHISLRLPKTSQYGYTLHLNLQKVIESSEKSLGIDFELTKDISFITMTYVKWKNYYFL